MAAPSLATEAALANGYPSNRFNQRERQLLASVKAYVDSLPAGSITLAELSSGITYTHRVVAAGTFTTAGGDANEAITATGALGTDLAFVQLRTVGATPRTILTAVAATNAINLVFSGDPSTDHVVCWQLLRAAT